MFEFRKVDQDKQLLDEIYRLRYKVYCDEWGFEKPEDHPDGIEIDDYDKHSAHFAAFWEDGGSMIGTVRLIRSSESGFPLFRHCTVDADLSFLREDAMGEISRLAISKELRRRRPDRALLHEDAGNWKRKKHLLQSENEEKTRTRSSWAFIAAFTRNASKRV